MSGSPAIPGSFVAIRRRGGGEDPWLCVPDRESELPFSADNHLMPDQLVNPEILLCAEIDAVLLDLRLLVVLDSDFIDEA